MSTNEPEEDSHPLSDSSDTAAVSEAPVRTVMVNVVLLFVAAVLYDFAVGGAVSMLGAFVLKEPLSWTATQVILQYVYLCIFIYLFGQADFPISVFSSLSLSPCCVSLCSLVMGTQQAV